MITPHRMQDGLSCSTCGQEQWKYACPRCEMVACSLACQKNHSISCQDSFQAELVRDGLDSMRFTPGEKRNFDAILNRTKDTLDSNDLSDNNEEDTRDLCDPMTEDEPVSNEEYESEDEDEDQEQNHIHELKQRARTNELSLEHLTQEQRSSFKSALARGLLMPPDRLALSRVWWHSIELPPTLRAYKSYSHLCCGPNHHANRSITWQIVSVAVAWTLITVSTSGDYFLDTLMEWDSPGEGQDVDDIINKNLNGRFDLLPPFNLCVTSGKNSSLNTETMASFDDVQIERFGEAESRIWELLDLSEMLVQVSRPFGPEDTKKVLGRARDGMGYSVENIDIAVQVLHKIFGHRDRLKYLFVSISTFIDIVQRSLLALKSRHGSSPIYQSFRDLSKTCSDVQRKLKFLSSFIHYHYDDVIMPPITTSPHKAVDSILDGGSHRPVVLLDGDARESMKFEGHVTLQFLGEESSVIDSLWKTDEMNKEEKNEIPDDHHVPASLIVQDEIG